MSPLPASPRGNDPEFPGRGSLAHSEREVAYKFIIRGKSAAQTHQNDGNGSRCNFILPHVHFVYALGAFVFKLRIRHFLHLADIGNIIPCHFPSDP